jgi:hypothetical protein
MMSTYVREKIRLFYIILDPWCKHLGSIQAFTCLAYNAELIEGNNYNCVLCSNNVEETAHHLFFSCPFSQECWQHLGIQWNLQSEFFEMMIQSQQQHQNPFFMETFIIVAWHIWKQRNNFIFDRGRPSFSSWKNLFCEEAKLQAFRMRDDKRVAFLLCLDLS